MSGVRFPLWPSSKVNTLANAARGYGLPGFLPLLHVVFPNSVGFGVLGQQWDNIEGPQSDEMDGAPCARHAGRLRRSLARHAGQPLDRRAPWKIEVLCHLGIPVWRLPNDVYGELLAGAAASQVAGISVDAEARIWVHTIRCVSEMLDGIGATVCWREISTSLGG